MASMDGFNLSDSELPEMTNFDRLNSAELEDLLAEFPASELFDTPIPDDFATQFSLYPASAPTASQLVTTENFRSTQKSQTDMDVEDDDEEAEESLSSAALTPMAAYTPATNMLSDPRVTCNNKTALDARWPEYLIKMPTVQFNSHLRRHAMPDSELAELRKARRRYRSRGYSKTHRVKKSVTKQSLHDVDEESCFGMTNPEADARLVSLEAENAALRHQVQLLEHNLSTIDSLLQETLRKISERGISLEEFPQ